MPGVATRAEKENSMTRYVALLRGINVGGRKLIKMEELVRIFTSAGCRNTRTYILSGNVIFDSASTQAAALTNKIERALEKQLGFPVTVILRKLSQLEAIVRRNPFKRFATASDVVPFVVFLNADQQPKPKLPLISHTENLEIFEITDGAAFVVARRKKNGRFGFPNAVVEKQLGVIGTTRNWSSVNKVVSFAEKVVSPSPERKKR
jgi:uncharacterized protein (DUF1697 family)